MTNVPKKKVLLAGMLTLSLLAAAFVIPASAQESGEEQTRDKVREKVRDKVREHRPDQARDGTMIIGIGAAIDTEENKMYRSHLRFGIANMAAANSADAEHKVIRGGIVINDEGSPVHYIAVADTWTIEVREDKSAFTAEGVVEDREGNRFDVSLEGELLHETEHGGLYLVKGKFSGGDQDYELYYLAAVLHREAVRQVTDAVERNI